MEPIILASSSPRRQEILKLLNIPYQVIMPNIDETFAAGIETDEVPELLAREKALSVLHSLPQGQEIPWILSADTVVVLGGRIYGKPENQEQAGQFLSEFQGRTHRVLTAVILYNGRRKTTSSRLSASEVTFAPMSEREIQWYLDTGEWHGAAGGYRIQGLASCFIKSIRGSQSGITGLPIYELYDILREQGYSVLD